MRSEDVSAIILAAGLSTRMAPRNKLLIERKGETIIRKTVQTVLQAELGEVIVVTGHMAKEIGEALNGLPVTLVHNSNYADGMGASLACGASAVLPKAKAVMVCLGDMPEIAVDTIIQLMDSLEQKQRQICFPVFAGKRGHPVLFSENFIPTLTMLSGDVGAKTIIQEHDGDVSQIIVSDPNVLLDFDT